jgi:hypothetical protein
MDMKFFIQKTIHTPLISFDEGVFEISGRSIPENAMTFFEPFFKFIADYTKNPYPFTEVNISLEYANSSTNRSLMNVFTLLERIYENGHNIIIYWYYENGDEIISELGNDFKSILRLPFEVRRKSFA